MKILIVDDDETVLESLKRCLVKHDHEVDCALTAREAVGKVGEASYDFALVDYRMPGEDGVWFMRNAKLPAETKVLLITANVNRKVIKTMFDAGASGYLIKPFDEDELLKHIDFHSV